MIKRRRRLLAILAPLALGALVAVAVGGNGHATAAGGFVKADVKPRKDIKHDTSRPLRSITPKHVSKGKRVRAEHRFFTKGTPTHNDPVTQAGAPTGQAPTAGTSFDGIATAGLSANYIPPDPNAAVGPNAIVEVVNTAFQVFSKTGDSLYGPADTNTIWSGFEDGQKKVDCPIHNDGDATISYDRIANRWVLQQFALDQYDPLPGGSGEYRECIAVSATSDPLGEWHRYEFDGFGSEFPDYPKLGVWPDAYYVTYNLFPNDFSFDGPYVCAYERAKMLQGLQATQQCKLPGGDHLPDGVGDPLVNGLLPSDFDGSTLPPTGSPNYLLGIRNDPEATPSTSIVAYKMHVDWATPSHTTLLEDPTGPGAQPFDLACTDVDCDRIPQPGKGGLKLDSLGDRLMYRLAYRNMGSYEALVVNHSVAQDDGTTGVRWYELQKPTGDPWFTVANQATTWKDGKSRWMGSAAMDNAGNLALGYSISSSSVYPGLAYTGKLNGEATLTQGETVFTCGTTSNLGCGSQTTYSRWGDYSSMSIDPADDCTFWYTGEYLPKTDVFNWKTRIVSFQLPGCVAATIDQFSLSLSPDSDTIEQGSSDTSAVSTAVTNGAAQNVDLTATGAPYDTSVSFSPSSMTSNYSSTMTVDVGEDTPVGTYKITVRASGASDIRTKTYTLNVGLHNAVVNGDFEDGTPLAGWTPGGDTTLFTKALSSKAPKAPLTPTHSAQVGASTQAAGNSTLSQAVVVPAGQSSLSFWYLPLCSGAKTGDLLTVQLLDNANTQTLVQACKTSKNWVKAAFDTSAYAGQTVTLLFTATASGLAKKPTHMLVDDVVLSKQLPGIANGGFETNGLTGWQATGSGDNTPVVVDAPNPRHGGDHAVRLGVPTAPDYDPHAPGDSGISQAIVVPGVNPVLTLWYQPHCTDVGFDYIQVQVRKNPGGQVLRTLLSVCRNTAKWQKATFDVSAWAGQSVSLVLNVSSDDSFGTSAYFDDVSLTSG